jgi:hypothetical protein
MMTGLDTETGEVLWEEEQPLADYEEPFEMRHEPSWGVIHLRFVEQGEGTVHLLLDPSTGQVLAAQSAQPFWVLESGTSLCPEPRRTKTASSTSTGVSTTPRSGPSRLKTVPQMRASIQDWLPRRVFSGCLTRRRT